jgi:hypothetical protein
MGQRDPDPAPRAKDPAAIARGKLGGVIGGARRAANMTPEQRSERCATGRQGPMVEEHLVDSIWSFDLTVPPLIAGLLLLGVYLFRRRSSR